MALSNILKEPRREIIETIVGLSVAGIYFYIDYCFASLIANHVHMVTPEPWGLIFTIGFIAFWFITLALWALLLIVHGLGDSICNGLKKLGYDPRPTQRYN